VGATTATSAAALSSLTTRSWSVSSAARLSWKSWRTCQESRKEKTGVEVEVEVEGG
jgi:ABC-type glycerol-3-phosphate transport system substrate-binding protein